MKRDVQTKRTKKNVASKPKRTLKVTQQYSARVERPKGTDELLQFFVGTFLRVFSYIFVFLLGSFVTFCIGIGILAGFYLRIVATHSGISSQELVSLAKRNKDVTLPSYEGRTNLLILGTDALANRDEASKLTDTLMVVSVDTQAGKLTTFSLPRDLWIASQSGKINTLYQKGQEPLVQTVVGDITGIPIHRVIVMDIATVGKLIDAFGGLDVQVERSFIDYKFPRSDVDVRVERDPAKLYETVAFSQGTEHMSGDRALRFIRSRHSLDPVEGTDDARVKRQQRVIEALLLKLKDPLILRNPEQIGRILSIYKNDISSGMSLQEASTLGWSFVEARKYPSLQPHQFTSVEVDTNGVLMHPNKFPGGAWVYLPVDPTYTQMRATVKSWLEH